MIGEDPQGIPNNLMPYVAQVDSTELDIVPAHLMCKFVMQYQRIGREKESHIIIVKYFL
jgi:hypothetical protein